MFTTNVVGKFNNMVKYGSPKLISTVFPAPPPPAPIKVFCLNRKILLYFTSSFEIGFKFTVLKFEPLGFIYTVLIFEPLGNFSSWIQYQNCCKKSGKRKIFRTS